jgi:hypothetical protein
MLQNAAFRAGIRAYKMAFQVFPADFTRENSFFTVCISSFRRDSDFSLSQNQMSSLKTDFSSSKKGFPAVKPIFPTFRSLFSINRDQFRLSNSA